MTLEELILSPFFPFIFYISSYFIFNRDHVTDLLCYICFVYWHIYYFPPLHRVSTAVDDASSAVSTYFWIWKKIVLSKFALVKLSTDSLDYTDWTPFTCTTLHTNVCFKKNLDNIDIVIVTLVRDIHIECSKQFKWNS